MKESPNKKLKPHSHDFSYSWAGVDRSTRERSRVKVIEELRQRWNTYAQGRPLELPFGPVFPTSKSRDSFLDLQIEGIGTKTLLAELDPNGHSLIGIDGVAMAVNDVVRSGAAPFLLADAIHISKSSPTVVTRLVKGIEKGAELAGCVLASGETGDVSEILHSPLLGACADPFDLIVSCLGVVDKCEVVKGFIDEGDVILGIESSGIHSNGISLARKVLLKAWGGKYDLHDIPEGMGRPLIRELLEPTRIYAREIIEAARRFGLKAAIHITGDGFGKFQRLLDSQRKRASGKVFGVEIGPMNPPSGIFGLIERTSKEMKKSITREEMYRTFNMGYGFAVIAENENADNLVDLFNKYHTTRRIGRVTKSGKIVIRESGDRARPVIL